MCQLIVDSMEVGIEVMVELCKRVVDWMDMPAELVLSIMVQIFKGKGDIMNFSSHNAMKLIEHGMYVVNREYFVD